jgi:Swi5-dependent recombination DNA repair protein 1
MSTPAAKRQRIDAASHALSKPFRSPLKVSLATTIPHDLPSQKLGSCFDDNHSKDTHDAPVLNSDEATSRPRPTATPLRTKLLHKLSSTPTTNAALNGDPHIAALIKSQRQLEKQLRDLKEELDTAEQARKIEVDSQKKNPSGEVDGELLELIKKWRGASREAAEELFTSVRDKVNRYAWADL